MSFCRCMGLMWTAIEDLFGIRLLNCVVGEMDPSVLGRDFNITRFLSERLGDSHIGPTMVDLSDLIFFLDLVDLLLVGVNLCGRMGERGLGLKDLLYLPLERFIFLIDKRDVLGYVWSISPILLDCGGLHEG